MVANWKAEKKLILGIRNERRAASSRRPLGGPDYPRVTVSINRTGATEFRRAWHPFGRRAGGTIVAGEFGVIRATRLAKTGNRIPADCDAPVGNQIGQARVTRGPWPCGGKKRGRQRKRAIQSELIKSTNRNFTASRGHSISPGLSKAFVDAGVTCRERLAGEKFSLTGEWGR